MMKIIPDEEVGLRGQAQNESYKFYADFQKWKFEAFKNYSIFNFKAL